MRHDVKRIADAAGDVQKTTLLEWEVQRLNIMGEMASKAKAFKEERAEDQKVLNGIERNIAVLIDEIETGQGSLEFEGGGTDIEAGAGAAALAGHKTDIEAADPEEGKGGPKGDDNLFGD
jgi:hypothetical protein